MATDYDRIVDIIKANSQLSKADTKKVADGILGLFIEIAGERIETVAQAKADIYRSILTNKMVKDEFLKTIYEQMQHYEERVRYE